MKHVNASNPHIKTMISLVLFYGYFGFCMGIFLYRGGIEYWGQLPVIRNFIHDQHISNFALSGLLTLTAASYPASRQQYRYVWIIAGLVAVLNIYTETGDHFYNVPDAIDIIAGILGILGALLTIWLIKKFGTYQRRP